MIVVEDMREITCIACPIGCRLAVSRNDNGQIAISNHGCKRGLTYGEQEFTRPMRMVTSSVFVLGGKRPLCAVKTKEVVPKDSIAAILREIQSVRVQAPVQIGQVIVSNIAGTGVDLVATANCS